MSDPGFTFECVRTDEGDFWKAGDVILAMLAAADFYEKDENERGDHAARVIRGLAQDFSAAMDAPMVKEPDEAS